MKRSVAQRFSRAIKALARERRTNRRLRELLTDLDDRMTAIRREQDLQFARIAQMQVEIDALKKKRPSVA